MTRQRWTVRPFDALRLSADPTTIAPDGSEVRTLLGLAGGTMAHFRLAPGQISRAVCHRTVEEIWYVVDGGGRMWRRQGEREEIVALGPGLCLTIPLGTHFQFRADSDRALAAIAVTMPPWPGPDEAFAVEGPWPPSAVSQPR